MKMRRREFTAGLGSAVALPLAARAQQPALPVIGFLDVSIRPNEFRRGLNELGYVEGQNVAVEYYEDQNDRLPAVVAELVRRRVAVLVAPTNVTAVAAKAATSTIPIVFSTGSDPVKLGLVPSLSRPGGNMTGFTLLNTELLPKRLELLHEVVPSARSIAVLLNPINPNAETQLREVQGAANTLGLQLHILHPASVGDLDAAFARMAQLQAGALVIGPGLPVRPEQVAALTLRHAVAAIYQVREFAAAGGLMSYGGSAFNTMYLAGLYAGRILKGEKPGDLPVQQRTKIELVINLKTARVLGLTVPLTLIGRADELIE
jgi:putative ABC transport system substrate-binding protein